MARQNRKKTVDHRNRNVRRVRHQSNRAKEARANESRVAHTVRPTVRQPGTLLNLPKPPNGIVYHWISKEIFGGKSDIYDSRIEEGWKPIDPSTLPNGHLLPQTQVGRYGNCITVRGMVACQMSEAQANANAKVYEDQARHEQDVIRQRGLADLKGDGVLGSREAADQVFNSVPDSFVD